MPTRGTQMILLKPDKVRAPVRPKVSGINGHKWQAKEKLELFIQPWNESSVNQLQSLLEALAIQSAGPTPRKLEKVPQNRIFMVGIDYMFSKLYRMRILHTSGAESQTATAMTPILFQWKTSELPQAKPCSAETDSLHQCINHMYISIYLFI